MRISRTPQPRIPYASPVQSKIESSTPLEHEETNFHSPLFLHPIQAESALTQDDDILEERASTIATQVELAIAQQPSHPFTKLTAPTTASTFPYPVHLGQGGHLLNEPLRTKMENGFGGENFSDVRIHDAPSDLALALSLGAEAFTLGTHIFGSLSNPATLAHELEHVRQQRSRQCPLMIQRKLIDENSQEMTWTQVSTRAVQERLGPKGLEYISGLLQSSDSVNIDVAIAQARHLDSLAAVPPAFTSHAQLPPQHTASSGSGVFTYCLLPTFVTTPMPWGVSLPILTGQPLVTVPVPAPHPFDLGPITSHQPSTSVDQTTQEQAPRPSVIRGIRKEMPRVLARQSGITPIRSIDNPKRVGLEQEFPDIGFPEFQDSSVVLAETEAKALDQIPLLQLTTDLVDKSVHAYMELITGPEFQTYQTGDYFAAQEHLMNSFYYAAMNALEQRKKLTLGQVLQIYDQGLELNEINPEYRLVSKGEIDDTPVQINLDHYRKFSTQVNLSIPYDTIGNLESGFIKIFGDDWSRVMYIASQKIAAELTHTIDPSGGQYLTSLFTQLFFHEVQAADAHNKIDGRYTFDSKDGTSFLFRASGEDVISSILSHEDILALYQWITRVGFRQALQIYTQHLQQVVTLLKDHSINAELAGTDISYENRFESMFGYALQQRIVSGRGQLPDALDYWLIEGLTIGEDETDHLGIPDDTSRRPIREYNGRYYIVVENRQTDSSVNKALGTQAGWKRSNPGETSLQDIEVVQTSEFHQPTTSMSRGELLTRVLTQSLQKNPHQLVSPALIDALKIEHQQQGLDADVLLEQLLDLWRRFESMASLQTDYVNTVNLILEKLPGLIDILSADNRELLQTYFHFPSDIR